ncbi:Protein O-mannosyltransferase 2 [Mortierella sp. GBA39]|nr:Protein O-mannosyltransferase 2 [Mortierella sp. GBA39]
MLIGLSGILAGYDGSFDFESGAICPDIYRFMRLFNATLGVVMVPLAFWTAISRAFSAKWWMWLSMMGVGVGVVSSMKWVGFFVTTLATYVMHWVARSILLIALPATIYISCFIAHFHILSNTGPGDAYMPSLFQANLNGSDFSKNPLQVAYSSLVTIKSSAHGGGLLHSHVQTYPQGLKQQQVTTYHHKDHNNEWILARSRDKAVHHLNNPPNNNNEHLQILKSGDILRRQHNSRSVVPAPEPMQYKSNFWQDFIHLNVAMMKYNSGPTQDPDKDDHLASLPSQWPFLAIGIRMNRWFDNNIKIYLLGNPIVWWSGTMSLGVFVCTLAYYIIVRGRQQQQLLEQEKQQQQDQEQENDDNVAQEHQSPQPSSTTSISAKMTDQEWERFKFIGKTTLGGWILHYLPSFIMGRVMYLHHYFPTLYFPALYFTILLHAFLIDHLLHRLAQHRPFVKTLVWGVAFAAVTITFIWFWPASYGIHGSVDT